MTTTQALPKTPGFNRRIGIWFDHDKHGRKVAYMWAPMQFRSFRLPLIDAETFIANETADLLNGHPFKAAR
jgi:hypothetical protein